MSQIDYATPSRKASSNVLLTQSFALLIDAYRQVNANKLFWVTLALSLLVAGAFGLVGFGDEGMTLPFFGPVLPPAVFAYIDKATFYKLMFLTFGVGIWLTWAQIILALVSTANIFPDLISGGSVDLYLSKPIGRLRLFVTKYIFGLMFVALQATAFTLASFLVLGLRGGVWSPGIFLAVPVVTIYFSFLFCVLVLIGVVTRSALASILLTILLWFVLFLVNATEAGLLAFRVAAEQQVEQIDGSVQRIDEQEAEWLANPDKAPGKVFQETRLAIRDGEKERRAEAVDTADKLVLAHRVAFAVKAPLPKTSETAELMRRWIVGSADLGELEEAAQQQEERRGGGLDPGDPSVQLELRERFDDRSALFVLGTSLGFEAIVVLLAAWIFARRDY
ncbi:MAG: hypothetical protein AAGD32_01895 [Planctomycetota bacterium]